MVPRILQRRERLRPIEYPLFDRIYLAALQSPWSHLEVPMGKDILDWDKISEVERKVIAGILKGFTLIESHVSCYWKDIVAKYLPHPEIVNMALIFSANERLHAKSYDYLESTLGIDTYDAFLQDEVANKKLDNILSRLESHNDLALSLAIFSGAVEGVSLFSSFAVLLSFSQKGLFKGMAQILSWSAALDEENHSKAGIALYKELIKEGPELEPSAEKIYEGFRSVVDNEIQFVEQVFSEGDLSTITKNEAIDFIKYRANLKLMELSLPPIYDLTGENRRVRFFFETLLKGKSMNDFFVQGRNGQGYSAKLSQDFRSCNSNILGGFFNGTVAA